MHGICCFGGRAACLIRLLERNEPPRELPRGAPSAPSLPSAMYVRGELLCAGPCPELTTSALPSLGRAPTAIGCVDCRESAAAAHQGCSASALHHESVGWERSQACSKPKQA